MRPVAKAVPSHECDSSKMFREKWGGGIGGGGGGEGVAARHLSVEQRSRALTDVGLSDAPARLRGDTS